MAWTCVVSFSSTPARRLLYLQVRALTLGRPHHDALKDLINKKEIVGDLLNQLR